MKRQAPLRQSLEGSRFDVIVIGGGINGVAIARECARAGRTVLLLERNDFAAGTTSRATRIVHGGLRYLEHGEIALVRESLRERQRLLAERPHLVRPLRFLLALGPDARRSALEIRAGLWIYRRMGGRGSIDSRADHRVLQGLLDSGERWSIFDYEDAQCEFPERLVAEWLVEARQYGATACNHAEVLEVVILERRAVGVRVRDLVSQEETCVAGDWVINASGPWADAVCRRSGVAADRMIGGVRGSHIVLPRFPHAPESALYLEAVDGRPIFVVPWNGQILVGTTEIRDDGDPAEVQPDTEEIDYLVKSLAKQLPGAAISADQIKFAYAGVRPLPRVTEENPAAITRRHFLHDHADDGAAGMISVVGGKLTTAASLARECAARIGCAMAQESAVHVLPPRGGAEFRLEDWARGAAESSGLAPQCARAIAEWFGRSAASVLDLARRDPNMRQRLCPHSAHVVAEAVHAMFCEQALTLGDVLLRRVPLALGSCWSPECARSAAQHIGHALGWNDRQVAAELDLLIAEQETFLKKPVSAALHS